MYAKFYQNILNGLRVIDIFHESSRTGRGQNLHKLSGDKVKCLIVGHSMKVNLQFQLTFLGSCNFVDALFFLFLFLLFCFVLFVFLFACFVYSFCSLFTFKLHS